MSIIAIILNPSLREREHQLIAAWQWAVLLTPVMWGVLKGDTQPTTLEEAGRLLPTVLEIQTRGGTLVVVEYALWKAKVKVKEENPNGKDVG